MIDLIRKENLNIPILITSGLTTPQHVDDGYKHIIDNYIKKPFTPGELDGYIKALFRRMKDNNHMVEEADKLFPIGAYVFDFENRCLKYNEKIKVLSRREALILKMLYDSEGKLVKRSVFLKAFWGVEKDFFHSRSLDVFINNLRKYLKDDKSVKIETLRGEGLILIC
jgi:DNA-binding response OmpR family regulator